jgi:hypothetical protein
MFFEEKALRKIQMTPAGFFVEMILHIPASSTRKKGFNASTFL